MESLCARFGCKMSVKKGHFVAEIELREEMKKF
jgi:hypothetical protein